VSFKTLLICSALIVLVAALTHCSSRLKAQWLEAQGEWIDGSHCAISDSGDDR
jgi:hypothetical protein